MAAPPNQTTPITPCGLVGTLLITSKSLRKQLYMPALDALRTAVMSHTGEFLCSQIQHSENTKTVEFRHIGSPPNPSVDVPKIEGLRDFYDTFAELTLYLDERTGEAAFLIASPSEWPQLDDYFRPWLDGIDEDEAADFLPGWVKSCLVVGEVPRSGNYLLVPTVGADAGVVFEFDHDGLEFIRLGDNLPDFVARTLDLDTQRLTGIASHIRFIEPSDSRQWWIDELRDNRGNVVRTEA